MDEYLGIVKLFAGSFAPRGWMFCAGQLLPINQNQALFSLLGTVYGGDGRTTFALPNLMSSVAIGAGQGPGRSNYNPGQMGGHESITLSQGQMPAHTHTAAIGVSSSNATDSVAKGGQNLGAMGYMEGREFNNTFGYVQGAANVALAADSVSVGVAGNSLPVDVRQPYLAMNYIICVNGLFPPRQ